MGQVPILLPWGRVLVDICALPHFDDIIHNIIIRGWSGKCKRKSQENRPVRRRGGGYGGLVDQGLLGTMHIQLGNKLEQGIQLSGVGLFIDFYVLELTDNPIITCGIQPHIAAVD